MAAPRTRQFGSAVIDMPEREPRESRRKGIRAVVIRNPEGPHEADAAMGISVNLGETEAKCVMFQFNHDVGVTPLLWPLAVLESLPIAISNLPYNSQDCMVRELLELPEQVREDGRAPDDDLLQVIGDFARHCEQQVTILA